MSMEMLELLRTLTECPGVSGSEMPIAARGAELLRPYCSQVETASSVHAAAPVPMFSWMPIWIRWDSW